MSKLGKILLYVAVAGAVVAVVAGIGVIQKRAEDKANMAQVQSDKDAALKDAAKNKAEAEALKKAKDDDDAQLATANASVTDMQGKLTDAQKSATDAQGALATANAATKTAQDALTQLQAGMDGKTPDDFKADVAKAQADLATAENEKKILEDSSQSLQKQVADLKDAINRKDNGGTMPPGVSGRVTFVNRTWNFVVLDVGLSNGVVPNGELIVFRKNSFLGKVKVTSAEANSCVADILPNLKGDIQVGDYVLN